MKYYKSCDSLPLKNFLKVMETSDYKYLVIADDYDFQFKADLGELWQTILNEYSTIDGNDSILSGFKAYKEIHQLIFTYEIIQAMIYSLHYRYNQSYIDDLAIFGYKVEIIDNIITLDSLAKCTQMSRAILNDIDELKNLSGTTDKKETNSFYKIMAWLIKGYGNLEDNITVSKYLALKQHLIKSQRDGRDQRK